MNKYDDIINIPHFDPVNHTRMSMEARAAQFSPFAALTGYSDMVIETGRLTKTKKELSDDDKEIIDMKLLQVEAYIKEKPEISIIYFVKDKKKEGGDYQEYTGNIRRIDKVNGKLIFTDKTNISINDIIDIKFNLG